MYSTQQILQLTKHELISQLPKSKYKISGHTINLYSLFIMLMIRF
ncbi:unnamed protein product [Paramecium octaurelia]|uniref:Uncharacterized protein n=1 Tax=Paramecium octaurelia TaxID=43137 RepID=A0A8S1T348_PAROT|nr:unnamed protein product [Paramecium octaurelia]